MDEPKADHETVDVESIRSLDTARMALRWALERLRTLGDHAKALELKLATSEAASKRAVAGQEELRKALLEKSGGAGDRELYYRKLEEFLSLRLEGAVDLAALARREADVDKLKALLEGRLADLGQELSARRAALEREHQHALEKAQGHLRERERSIERSFETRSRQLEHEHLAKLAELRERELLLRQEEKAFSERQTRLEEYYASQRAELEAQLRSLRQEIESQARGRAELAQRLLENRQEALELSWNEERALLMKEVEAWKARARRAEPALAELETRLAGAEEAARQARAARDAQALVFEEQRKGFEELKRIWESRKT